MPTTLEADVAGFVQAAKPHGDKVWVSRATQIFVREFMVRNDWIAPQQSVVDSYLYAAALDYLIPTGTLPVKVKTAEEIAAEQRAAEQLAARKKMGVVNYEEKPVRKLAVEQLAVNRAAEHNAQVDERMNSLNRAQNQREAMGARINMGEAIPGLKDEREQVYTSNGLVNHYRTGVKQQENREHNQRVRAAYAARQKEGV
jgi:hypothetical protein